MLEQQVIVLGIEGDRALVEARESGSCGSCGSGGCATRRLAELFGRQRRVFPVANALGARVGDEVVIGIPSGMLWRAALRLYGVPMALVVFGALAGQRFGGDAMALIAAAGGLFAALLWQRISPASAAGVPVMLRRAGCDGGVVVKSC